MPSAIEIQSILVLQAAASAQFGIVVVTNDVVRCRTSIYTARKSLGDPTYADLQIRVSPNEPNGELWIIKKNVVSGFTIGQENASSS